MSMSICCLLYFVIYINNTGFLSLSLFLCYCLFLNIIIAVSLYSSSASFAWSFHGWHTHTYRQACKQVHGVTTRILTQYTNTHTHTCTRSYNHVRVCIDDRNILAHTTEWACERLCAMQYQQVFPELQYIILCYKYIPICINMSLNCAVNIHTHTMMKKQAYMYIFRCSRIFIIG